ncbi:hypothetical protein BDW02DRAFT_599489 [Decorospora gaudefroyi]|uniref:Uncharacterized protein n=1 Tax=Decorospora gaudefroyi TaxID=184978 RepID=A0A6A5K5F7_9PLEO|nr:hypothetical protein BDW02DRAFT_599489 [Decorospora gaudefroyi]
MEMERLAEDYYDMPVEMLPSANFAGRPRSEIGMLDGLWSVRISSASEDGDEDGDENVTSQPRTPTRPSQSSEIRTESAGTSRITTTSDDSRGRMRSLSNEVKILDRPGLRKKAHTAPPGAFDAQASPPLRPRRAISARLGYSYTIKKAARRLPASPSSMLATPRELYAIPERRATSDTVPSPRECKRRSVMSTSPGAFSSFTLSGVQGVDACEGIQKMYLPGAITLVQNPAAFRKDSVATGDPFTKAECPERLLSDLKDLDGVVMFFDDFGVIAHVTDATLDQYWLHGSRSSEEDLDARKASLSSVEDTAPKAVAAWGAQRTRGSNFSFSSASASSTASAPAPEKRKRDRLRGLLSPGLPGSAFLKSSASR